MWLLRGSHPDPFPQGGWEAWLLRPSAAQPPGVALPDIGSPGPAYSQGLTQDGTGQANAAVHVPLQSSPGIPGIQQEPEATSLLWFHPLPILLPPHCPAPESTPH